MGSEDHFPILKITSELRRYLCNPSLEAHRLEYKGHQNLMTASLADIKRRKQALEMRCFRKLLSISYRDHNQWGNESQNLKCHQAVWRPDFSEKMQTKVRACHMIIWTGQDYSPGNNSRRETKRQTKETMGRQHQRVDWPWMEYHTMESREPQGVEKASCKIYSGAPTVSQTMG